MPTVAACGLHFDARASSPHAFLLDAGELCSNAFMAGLSDLTVTSGQFKSQTDFRMGGDASDSLLLGGLHYSDDELSPGSSHVNGAAAMQFLLLDDDEVAGTGLQDPAKPALDGCFAATSAGLGGSDGAMLRQQSGHSCEAATRSSVPVVDSSALYCLAVVDELTGLPLRPATPEETWEVERCFVLQQQSELIEAGMLPELQHHQPLEQLQEGPLAASRAGSADVSAVGDEGLHHQHLHQQAVSQGPSHTLDPQEEQEEEEQPKAESSKRSKEAAARAAGPPQRRPDQPRRCGPCDNCGATESPQWRQGPPAKPLLCNACGMRFRRTNQLVAGETGASGVRGGARAHKKAVAPPADAEADLEVARPTKASKAVAPPLVAPDAKRPRRAAAVAAAATFAAAAIDVM